MTTALSNCMYGKSISASTKHIVEPSAAEADAWFSALATGGGPVPSKRAALRTVVLAPAVAPVTAAVAAALDESLAAKAPCRLPADGAAAALADLRSRLPPSAVALFGLGTAEPAEPSAAAAEPTSPVPDGDGGGVVVVASWVPAPAEAASASGAPDRDGAAAGGSGPSASSSGQPEGSGGRERSVGRRRRRDTKPSPPPPAVVLSARRVTRSAAARTITLDEMYDAVLPPAAEVPRPTSFETAGHVARLNLLPPQWPWRRVIGRVLLARNPSLGVVVAKTDSIDPTSVFRTLPLEVVAGAGEGAPPAPLWVRLRESGCRFELDYRAVYWNSRLATAHRILVDDVAARAGAGEAAAAAPAAGRKRARGGPAPLPDSPAGRVLDMTAGVGPFAVPLARRGLWVRANDLNPASAASCAANGRRNRLPTALAPWGDAAAAEAAAAEAAASLDEEDVSRGKAEGEEDEDEEDEEDEDEEENGGEEGTPKRAAVGAGGSAERRSRPWRGVVVAADAASLLSARLQCTCEDGGAAVRRAGGTGEGGAASAWPFGLAVSNLPDRGVRLLSSFRRAVSREAWGTAPLPCVVVFAFARGDGARPTAADVDEGVRRRVAMALDPDFHRLCCDHAGVAHQPEALLDAVPAHAPTPGEPALPAWAAAGGSAGVTVAAVRDVSPRKLMVRIDVQRPPAELVEA